MSFIQVDTFYIYSIPKDTIYLARKYEVNNMSTQFLTAPHSKCHMQNSCAQYQNCPMITVHKLISGKWKILILWYINDQTLRFSDLKKKLPDITQKMLTNQLRSLEEDGLISRTVYPVVPPKVEYALTEIGLEMLPLLKSMYDYGVTYNNSQKS